MSFTLQDLIFPAAWFQCKGSVHHPLYRQPCIQLLTSDPFFQAVCFLKYTLSLIWKLGAG